MSGSDPGSWPAGIEQIGMEDLGRLGINKTDQLFWDGRRIEVRQSLAFTGFQKVITGIVTFCFVMGALGGFVTGFNNASIYLCARGIDWLTCPHAPEPLNQPQRGLPGAPIGR